jgi:predicted ATPase
MSIKVSVSDVEMPDDARHQRLQNETGKQMVSSRALRSASLGCHDTIKSVIARWQGQSHHKNSELTKPRVSISLPAIRRRFRLLVAVEHLTN